MANKANSLGALCFFCADPRGKCALFHPPKPCGVDLPFSTAIGLDLSTSTFWLKPSWVFHNPPPKKKELFTYFLVEAKVFSTPPPPPPFFPQKYAFCRGGRFSNQAFASFQTVKAALGALGAAERRQADHGVPGEEGGAVWGFGALGPWFRWDAKMGV